MGHQQTVTGSALRRMLLVIAVAALMAAMIGVQRLGSLGSVRSGAQAPHSKGIRGL